MSNDYPRAAVNFSKQFKNCLFLTVLKHFFLSFWFFWQKVIFPCYGYSMLGLAYVLCLGFKMKKMYKMCIKKSVNKIFLIFKHSCVNFVILKCSGPGLLSLGLQR